jgi:hypothetical protein
VLAIDVLELFPTKARREASGETLRNDGVGKASDLGLRCLGETLIGNAECPLDNRGSPSIMGRSPSRVCRREGKTPTRFGE